MDKAERGLLLVDKEDTEKDIRNIRESLKRMGNLLSSLSSILTLNPERISFSCTPDNIKCNSFNISQPITYDWNEIPSKENIVSLICELREKLNHFSNIQQQLNR